MNNLEKQDERNGDIQGGTGGCARIAGRPANWQGTMQLAHLIAETKANRKRYGIA